MTEEEPQANLVKPLLLASAGVVVCWLLLWAASNYLNATPTDRGQFGDSFGFANSLFSALAFAGVIVALFMQMHELRLQRQEIRDTREELKRSAAAQEATEERLATAAQLDALAALLVYYDRVAMSEISNKPIRVASTARDEIVGHIEAISLRLSDQRDDPLLASPLLVQLLKACRIVRASYRDVVSFKAGESNYQALRVILERTASLLSDCGDSLGESTAVRFQETISNGVKRIGDVCANLSTPPSGAARGSLQEEELGLARAAILDVEAAILREVYPSSAPLARDTDGAE